METFALMFRNDVDFKINKKVERNDPVGSQDAH